MRHSRSALTRRLPEKPDLAQLRKQAKDLLKAFHAGETATVEQVRFWFPGVITEPFQLSDAQFAIARAYGFPTWPKLKAFVDGVTVSRFLAAVEAGDAGAVRAMLRRRPELVHMDTSADDERRALHRAVLARDAAMVRLLIEAGADARQGIFPHRDATSAFALARDRGYDDIVGIIEQGKAKRAGNHRAMRAGETPDAGEAEPVRDAVALGDRVRVAEMVAANPGLLRNTDWRRGGLLSLAVNERRIDMVRLLLDLGADPDERTTLRELEEPTESWGGPLWYAARTGQLDIAELLLDRGADANGNVYASGWPLLNAYERADEPMKRLLIARGAKMQPYMASQFHDTAEAARMLAQDAGEELARELAWSAAGSGCDSVLAMSLARLRWPPNDPRWNWILIQPMRRADAGPAHEGFFRCLALLLDHGVDANASSRFAQTPLHFTAARDGLDEADRARFASMLLDRGARLDLRDGLLQSTPLGWACRWGRRELVDLFLSRGAPANEADAEPWATPMAWAKKMGHQQIEATLRDVAKDQEP